VIQENEIVMLILGGGVLVFTLINLSRLKRIPAWKILITGFYVLLAGFVLTVLESFFWKDFLNLLEHMCYAASSAIVAVWCWKVFESKKEAK
jgi:hypothetical protein